MQGHAPILLGLLGVNAQLVQSVHQPCRLGAPERRYEKDMVNRRRKIILNCNPFFNVKGISWARFHAMSERTSPLMGILESLQRSDFLNPFLLSRYAGCMDGKVGRFRGILSCWYGDRVHAARRMAASMQTAE